MEGHLSPDKVRAKGTKEAYEKFTKAEFEFALRNPEHLNKEITEADIKRFMDVAGVDHKYLESAKLGFSQYIAGQKHFRKNNKAGVEHFQSPYSRSYMGEGVGYTGYDRHGTGGDEFY